VLCLNNDTVVAPDFLEPLVQALEKDTKAGVAVPHIFYCHEPNQLWYIGGEYVQDFPTFERFGGPAWHLPTTTVYLECKDPYSTQVATGCALLIRASLMKTLGGFDDRYFAYYEDVDLNYRLEKQGVSRLVVPAAKVWHKESRSTGGPLSPTVHFYMTRNAWMIVQDHIATGIPRQGKLYRRYQKLYRQKAYKLVGQNSMPKQDWERAQSILYGVWCAKHGWYGRRQGNRWVETRIVCHLAVSRAKQRLLQSTVYKLRAFWFLNACWQKILWSLHMRGALVQEHP
jgi:GT2 family glycosyltransferase